MLSKLMAKLAPAVFSQRPTAALLRTIRVSRWEGTTRFRNRSVTASLLSLIAVCGVMLLTMGPGYGQLLPTVPVPGRPYTTLGPNGQLIVHPSRAIANRIIVGLRPGVFLYIIVRQIAGPHSGLGIAQSQVYFNGYLICA